MPNIVVEDPNKKVLARATSVAEAIGIAQDLLSAGRTSGVAVIQIFDDGRRVKHYLKTIGFVKMPQQLE